MKTVLQFTSGINKWFTHSAPFKRVDVSTEKITATQKEVWGE